MNKDINYYRTINNTLDRTMQEAYLEESKLYIINNFESMFPCYQVDINGIERIVSIFGSSNSFTKEESLNIICKPNEPLTVGNIVTWGSNKWLVVKVMPESISYFKGKIVKCNNELVFYKNNTLCRIPCYITVGSKNYIALMTNDFLTVPASKYVCYIPNEGILNKEDLNLRFMINGSAFSVEGIDNITMNGISVIEFNDDQLLSDDNLELGIANYYSNQLINNIVIKNGIDANLYYLNDTLQLEVECKTNGIIIDNPEIIYKSKDNNICTVSKTGLITAIGTGNTEVVAIYNNVSASIKINVSITKDNNFNIVISPDNNTLKLSRTIKFVSTVFNNGVIDTEKQVGYSVTNADGSNNKYAEYNINGNSCSINAINKSAYIGKEIIVRAYLLADNSVFTEHKIKIISLL